MLHKQALYAAGVKDAEGKGYFREKDGLKT